METKRRNQLPAYHCHAHRKLTILWGGWWFCLLFFSFHFTHFPLFLYFLQSAFRWPSSRKCLAPTGSTKSDFIAPVDCEYFGFWFPVFFFFFLICICHCCMLTMGTRWNDGCKRRRFRGKTLCQIGKEMQKCNVPFIEVPNTL